MRIIAGKYRGRKLVSFAGEDVRPTADRVKESLFQILSPRLLGARVLDLFAGSGALGLEALSRGAAEAVFNDASAESLAILRKNLALLGADARTFRLDYRACIAAVHGAFDIVFADPPYRMDCAAEALGALAAKGALAEGGVVVYESEREEIAPAGWHIADVRRYGRTKITIFGREL